MIVINSYKGASAVAKYCRKKSSFGNHWHLRWKRVCASTEIDLSNWLCEKPILLDKPRAFIAGRQTHGKGQRGRLWHSPEGGVWLSAAIPYLGEKQSVGSFGLAVSLALAERLESRQIPVHIKWPNDLFVLGRKLAGFLPKLVFRGSSLKLARVGIGLNVSNKVPMGGISIAEILGIRNCCPEDWAAEVLLSLDRAIELFKKEEPFYLEAEKRLWAKSFLDKNSGEIYEIEGLDKNGALRLKIGDKKLIWTRYD